MFFGKFLRVGSLACGALIAAAGLPSIAGAQGIHLDESVSDDGSRPLSSRESRADFSPSFSGTARAPRTAADMARYGARPATDDFHERVRRAKPKVPRYARQSDAGPNSESVIGADGRTRITNTRSFPARATVLILFNGNHLCSGWLVNRDTVVTAGHCVAEGDGSPLYARSAYEIAPGYDRSASPRAPYGVCGAKRLYTNATWKNQGRDDFDYAAIKLDCNVGNQTGFFGYRRNVVQNNVVRVQGYPGDKPFGTQWQMGGRVTVLDPRRVFYDLDTAPGQSGSPVWRNVNENCPRCGIAIHAYGTYGGAPPYSNNNHGTRITDPVFQNLTNWKNAP
jgi:glutamyl endopeptidase